VRLTSKARGTTALSLGAAVFEWSSLVALVVYMTVAYGLARLVDIFSAPPRDI
jgi:hypothetical protein